MFIIRKSTRNIVNPRVGRGLAELMFRAPPTECTTRAAACTTVMQRAGNHSQSYGHLTLPIPNSRKALRTR